MPTFKMWELATDTRLLQSAINIETQHHDN